MEYTEDFEPGFTHKDMQIVVANCFNKLGINVTEEHLHATPDHHMDKYIAWIATQAIRRDHFEIIETLKFVGAI